MVQIFARKTGTTIYPAILIVYSFKFKFVWRTSLRGVAVVLLIHFGTARFWVTAG